MNFFMSYRKIISKGILVGCVCAFLFDVCLAAENKKITAKKYDQILKISETLNSVELDDIIKFAKKNKNFLCLAQNAYFEARGEPNIGLAAVSEVAIERSKNPQYPNSICGVIHQRKKVKGKMICQFSWYCEGRKMPALTKKEVQSNASWQRALRVSYMTYHDKMPNVTKGATHYFAYKKVNPIWKTSMKVDRTISNHTFLIASK